MEKNPEKPESAKMGRPPLHETAMTLRTIYATDDQWDRWRAAADTAGLSLSAWIRAAADKVTPADRSPANHRTNTGSNRERS